MGGSIQGGTFGTVYDEGGTISDGLGINPIKYEGDGWQYTASEDKVAIREDVTLKENEDLQTFLKEKERIDALVVQENCSLDATGYSLKQFNRLNNAGTIKGGTFICNSVSNSGTINGGTFENHTIPSLEKICTAFGITLSQLFAEEDAPVSLTNSQRKLLERWSRLSEEQQAVVFALIDKM